MEITLLSRNVVTDCANCGEILFAKDHDMDVFQSVIDDHYAKNPKCAEWARNLPTLSELEGISSG